LESGRPDAAIAELDKAIAADAKNAMAYMDRGLAQLVQGDAQAAERDFQKCLALDPTMKAMLDRRVQAAREDKKKVAQSSPACWIVTITRSRDAFLEVRVSL
jgi:tetratricopeptide (TPR) repeat protein